MVAQAPSGLFAQKRRLDDSPEAFGELRESNDILGDVDALRARMAEDGYLFLRDYLNKDDLLATRREILERVAAEGGLEEDAPLMEGILKPEISVSFRADLTKQSASLKKVIFDGPMMRFFEEFLGGEVRHLDFIWLRAVSPGRGTAPHGDSVFMNRGTDKLYTAWTPLGDIDRHFGGLIVLENSHKLDAVKNDYGQKDVDTFCANDLAASVYEVEGIERWFGQLSDNPVTLRERLGGRWLTADYRLGDVLIFTMYTLHASLDNQSENRLRLSTDTRYQLASDPVDERWIGDDPIAHGPDAKKGIIC
jgi:hypothetical protein